MNSVIQLKKTSKSQLSNAQRTFNRLKRKIENLERELKMLRQELDSGLQFYHERMRPAKKIRSEVLSKFIKLIYKSYKDEQSFSKNERKIIRKMISHKLYSIFNSTDPNEIDVEIHAIFKEIEGISYGEVASHDLDSMKEKMQEFFMDQGVDMDLSTINWDDGENAIMEKLFHAMDAATVKGGSTPPPKPKNKKQLQKEQKEQELKMLQEKGLGSIYKRLVKAFHPDLEQCSEQKAEKEELMKKLTCAYDKDDLHTLLSLEMEWMSRSDKNEMMQSDTQLEIYNSILKDQVEDLQEAVKLAPLDPKYLPIHLFLENAHNIRFDLQMVLQDLKEEANYFQSFTQELEGMDPKKAIQTLIKDFIQHVG